MKRLKEILRNRVMQYIASRYATYFLQFVNSIFIAQKLGPYYLGVYGFVTLIIQYLSQLNFGIPHGLNVMLSTNIRDSKNSNITISASLILVFIISIFSISLLGLINNYSLTASNKYELGDFLYFVMIIVTFGLFNQVFSNIYRIHGKITELAINQTLMPLLSLGAIIIFKDKTLLYGLLYSNVISFILSFIIFIMRFPIRFKFSFEIPQMTILLKKSGFLFLYNLSFYFIFISIKSFVSYYFDVKEFGYFTFTFTMANSFLMLFEALSYLIFPKMLNRFAVLENTQIIIVLDKIRDVYITSSHMLIHLAIFLFPFLEKILPEYSNTHSSFTYIALTLSIYTISFGYQGLLIARDRERQLSLLALSILILNVLLSYLLVHYFKVEYYSVVVSALFSYTVYIFILAFFVFNVLSRKTSFQIVFREIFRLSLFLPILISILITMLEWNTILYVIPLLMFMIFNSKKSGLIIKYIKTILIDQNVINI